MAESDIEYAVSEYAIKRGAMTLKLNVKGQIGWPDRLYIYQGQTLFIEFKAPGEKLRKMQVYVTEQMRKQLMDVRIIDNVTDGKGAIDELIKITL